MSLMQAGGVMVLVELISDEDESEDGDEGLSNKAYLCLEYLGE